MRIWRKRKRKRLPLSVTRRVTVKDLSDGSRSELRRSKKGGGNLLEREVSHICSDTKRRKREKRGAVRTRTDPHKEGDRKEKRRKMKATSVKGHIRGENKRPAGRTERNSDDPKYGRCGEKCAQGRGNKGNWKEAFATPEG